MKTDNLTIVDEVAPVDGHSTVQKQIGTVIPNLTYDKMMPLIGELSVGTNVKWIIVDPIRIKALRFSFGISAVGGDFRIAISKNGTNVASNLIVPAGVLVMEFPTTVLSSRDFASGDILEIVVTNVNGSKSAYHMTAQLDYSLRTS